MWAVCAFAICPLPIDSAVIGDLRRTEHWSERLNLVPGAFLRSGYFWHDMDVYGNFLLGIPFGFGLPFVVASKNSNSRGALMLCFAFAAGLELIQLAISLIFYGFPYRSIDIDDVIFVFAGTLFGYGVVRAAAYIYRRIGWVRGSRLPIWDHFHAVLLGVARAPK